MAAGRPLLLAAAVWVACSGAASAQPARQRFFFSGDGVLAMRNAHFDERLEVVYRDAEGRYDPAAQAHIELFFRSRSDGKSGVLALRLIELVDFVEDHAGSPALTLVSGYRSPELNRSLRDDGRRVAQASLHTEGLAADVAFAGVDLRRLWQRLRALEVGGVGLYQKDGFIHLDGGRPRFWEAATSGVESNLSAENARLFARTDFDRYDDLEGAVVRFHAVTALPILVHREVRLGEHAAEIVPLGEVELEDGCWVLRQPAERYTFAVATSVRPPPGRRAPLRLRTCAPRLGATPKEVLTNLVEARAKAPAPVD